MKVIHITPENAHKFANHIKNMKTFVKIFSPGCGHCENMKADWEKLEQSAKNMAGEIQLMDIHADAIDKIPDKRFNVSGFPTILLLDKNGKEEKSYTGDRSHDDMLNFLKREIDNLKRRVSGLDRIMNTMKQRNNFSGGKRSKRSKRTKRFKRSKKSKRFKRSKKSKRHNRSNS